jgi:hypothetical protein
VRGLTDLFDFLRPQLLYRQQAHPVKFPHRDLIHNTGIMQPLGRFVNDFKYR